MFDWARGSALKKMIEAGIPGAQYDPWLKGWSNAWPLALLKIPKGTRMLDIGTGTSLWYPNHFHTLGCIVHVLDQAEKRRGKQVSFGISQKAIKDNPHITFHFGLAGQKKAPAKFFDLITCISVLEHMYDKKYVLDPHNPFPHLLALEDMTRMLAPGGILVLTYDFFLGYIPRLNGWDFLMDYALLQQMGLQPLVKTSEPKDRTFIYNFEDTLFMQPEGIMSFSKTFVRETSIGMIFKKPGRSKIKLSPNVDCQKELLRNEAWIHQPSITIAKQLISKKPKTITKNILKKVKALKRI